MSVTRLHKTDLALASALIFLQPMEDLALISKSSILTTFMLICGNKEMDMLLLLVVYYALGIATLLTPS